MTQNETAAPSGFDTFSLPHALAKSLSAMKYTQPTPVQQQAIPAILKNKDVLAMAQTGTGKTGAFIIPILSKMMLDVHAHALIMAPTRELASQIMAVARQMAHGHSAITTALLIGGEGMGRQRAAIAAKPRLIIGTPGRMNDHLRDNPRMYMRTTILVLDEADRMLDMGFAPQIKDIIETTSPKRQTLMFSATFPANIQKFAQQYLNDPITVSIEPERTSAASIVHETLDTTEGGRYTDLLKELDAREGSIILFVKTKYGADRMAKKLADAKHSVDVLHGGLNQRQRDRAIAAFRAKKTRIMVATDVAARGLDVPHIEHVINYDLPQVAEDYVHRIGRTGRNGKEGRALSFVTPTETGKWRAIQRVLNPDAAKGERDSRRGPKRGPRRDHQDGERSEARSPRRGEGKFRQRREEGREEARKTRDDIRHGRGPEMPVQDSFSPDMELDDILSMTAARRERPERPHRAEKTFGEKSFGEKPFGKKPFGKKPFGDKPFGDKPRGDFKPRRDDADGDFARSDKPRGERSFGDKPFGKKPFGEKKFGDRKFGEKKFGDKPRGDFKPRRDDADGDFARADKPRGERAFGDKPRGDKPFGKKPFGEKSYGDKSFGDKPRGDFKRDGFKKGPKPEGAGRPRHAREDGERNFNVEGAGGEARFRTDGPRPFKSHDGTKKQGGAPFKKKFFGKGKPQGRRPA